MTTFDYETAHGAVTTAVWEVWTKNGRNMDQDEREETGKSANDAVTNSYIDGISLKDWQAAALKRLGGEG